MFNYLVTLSGHGFYPSRLTCISKLNTTTIQDTGETNNANQVAKFGYICIEGKSIQELYETTLNIKSESSHIDEVEFTVIRAYENQCNLEFSTNELNLIVTLNAHLSISCHRADEI